MKTAGRSSPDKLQVRELVAQPVAGRVQPPLDRTDRAVELGAHLLQRASLEVERDKGPAVEIAQAAETFAHARGVLALDDPLEGAGIGRAHPSQRGAVPQRLAR